MSKGKQLWRAVRAVTALGILAYLVVQVVRGWPAIAASSVRATALDVGLSLAFGVAALVGLPLAFARTLKRIDRYDPEHWSFYFRIWLQAYFYRYVPGKLLLVAERIRLGRYVGLDAPTSVLLVLWETVLLAVGASLVIVTALAMTGIQSHNVMPYLLGGVAASVALLALFRLLLNNAHRLGWLRRRVGELSRLDLSYAAQLELAVAYAAIWVCFGCSFFFMCRWFVPLELASAPTFVFWYVGAYVVGLVSSIAPAGLGVREGILVLGLSSVLPPGQATMLALAGRIWATFLELGCVGAARTIGVPGRQS